MMDKKLLELGVEEEALREAILQAFSQALEEKETSITEIKQAYRAVLEELSELKKQSAVEKKILSAGGRNTKAIMALLDMEEISLDEKGNLKGMDLDAIKEEAPYLFCETEEKRKGTGMTKAATQKKQDEIRAAFWGMK